MAASCPPSVQKCLRCFALAVVNWPLKCSPFSNRTRQRLAKLLIGCCLPRELVRPQNIFFKIAIFIQANETLPGFPGPDVLNTPKAPHSPVLSMVSRLQIGCRFAFSNRRLTHQVEEAPVSSLRIKLAVHRRNTSN